MSGGLLPVAANLTHGVCIVDGCRIDGDEGIPRHRLNTYGHRAFTVAGPMTFNTLPNDLRDPSVSTATFRQNTPFLCLSARLAD